MVIDLGPDPSYFYHPTWSPDSKHIAYADKHQHLWFVDVPSGQARARRQRHLRQLRRRLWPVWSPDSKWIAYHRDLDNQLHAIFLYSMDTHKFTQVTDGMSDASSPAFDPNGKYLYFLASTDDGPSHAGIDLSSLDRAQTTAAYVVVLAKDGASPIPPESDDEKIKDEKKDDKTTTRKTAAKEDTDKKDDAIRDEVGKTKIRTRTPKDDKDKPVKVTVDLDNIGNRILSLPIPAAQLRRHRQRQSGSRSTFLKVHPLAVPRAKAGGIHAIWRFTLEKRQPETVLNDVDSFTVSADGSKMLYARKNTWTIGPADDLKPGDGSPGKPMNIGEHADHDRSARRVAADLPRNLAHRARFSLRPQYSRPLAFLKSKPDTSPTSTASPPAPNSPISTSRCSAKSPLATCSSAVPPA